MLKILAGHRHQFPGSVGYRRRTRPSFQQASDSRKRGLQFLNTGLRLSNKSAFHALAIDEHRKAFAPTLWTVDFHKGAPLPHHNRTLSQVEQRWFVGAHANVGGGCQSDPLPQAPLKWMMDKATSRGLTFRRDLDPDLSDALPVISGSYSEFMNGAYKLLTLGKRYYCPVGPDPCHRRRRSASGRSQALLETGIS
jgi:hypothetical protein